MAAAPGTQPPSELDEEQLDQLIEEYKKMKASGHLDSLDDDFENHPFFMDHLPTEEDYEKNPYLKALRDLDYSDDHGPAELAVDCKERGNVAFKRGKAFYGNALKFYNDALRHIGNAPPSSEMTALESVVHSNLAAIFMSRKKLGMALDECLEALSLNPDNARAVQRGAKCAVLLGRYSKALELANKGLAGDPESKALQALAGRAQAGLDKVQRMAEAEAAKVQATKDRLAVAAEACAERGIRVGKPLFEDMRRTPGEPHITEDGCMHWPLVVLYPETGQSDYVQTWPEVDTLQSLLGAMLPKTKGAAPPLPWDRAGAYTLDNVDAFYVRNIVPAKPLEQAWSEWLPAPATPDQPSDQAAPTASAASAAEQPAPQGPHVWVQIPLAAPLLLPLVQPDHVVPTIPVIYVVGKGTPWYAAWRKETLRAMKATEFPCLAVPDLVTREEFEASQQ